MVITALASICYVWATYEGDGYKNATNFSMDYAVIMITLFYFNFFFDVEDFLLFERVL